MLSGWPEVRMVPPQWELWASKARFRVAAAGRRSGKTELAKRFGVLRAVEHGERVGFAAPTYGHAKLVYWDDLVEMVPAWMVSRGTRGTRGPRVSELCIRLLTGGELRVVGLDKPQRIEGVPWDGFVLDEYADMRPDVWGKHVRPALADRQGWCWFIGVPEGRNHFYDLFRTAQGVAEGGEWSAHHWTSAEVLPAYLGQEVAAAEIASAQATMDEVTFRQEFEAAFEVFGGLAYHQWRYGDHAITVEPRAEDPLVVCFDFNVAPGVAVVVQEGEDRTEVVGEVWIPRHSTTPAVCRKLVADWRWHGGPVTIYGDATGGAGGSAKVAGSDWDLVKAELAGTWPNARYRIPAANPRERARVNAVNSRLRSAGGGVRLGVDPQRAPHVVHDLENVTVLEGGSGEIDKKHNHEVSHLSDALGYYVEYEFPVRRPKAAVGGRVLTGV